MMWISLLLVLFFGTPNYQHQVIALNLQGCRVYNDFYVSCPGVRPPLGAIQIPDDAQQVLVSRPPSTAGLAH